MGHRGLEGLSPPALPAAVRRVDRPPRIAPPQGSRTSGSTNGSGRRYVKNRATTMKRWLVLSASDSGQEIAVRGGRGAVKRHFIVQFAAERNRPHKDYSAPPTYGK